VADLSALAGLCPLWRFLKRQPLGWLGIVTEDKKFVKFDKEYRVRTEPSLLSNQGVVVTPGSLLCPNAFAL
jgi:hypothetical protein